VIILKSFSYWDNETKTSVEKDLDLLRSFKGIKKTADISMVVIGNSRLRYGLDIGFQPHELIELPDGRNLAIVQYAIDIAGINKFIHLTDEILKSEPHYLIILKNLPTNNLVSQREEVTPLLISVSKVVFQYIYNRFILNLTAEEVWEKNRQLQEKPCLTEYSRSELDSFMDVIQGSVVHDLNGAETIKTRAYIDKAISQNIKVVLLEMPSYQSAVREYGEELHKLEYPGLGFIPSEKQILPALYKQVRWLAYTNELEQRHFCDYIHLGTLGRKQFTNWFLRQF
jgi:hypothetical protein